MSNQSTKSGIYKVYRGGVLSATFTDYGGACLHARMRAVGDACTVHRVNEVTKDETPLYRADLLRAAADWVIKPVTS